MTKSKIEEYLLKLEHQQLKEADNQTITLTRDWTSLSRMNQVFICFVKTE